MFDYPVTLSRDDNNTIMARVDGIPGATFGATETQAIENARDLILLTLAVWMRADRDLPKPRHPATGRVVSLNLLTRLKLSIYEGMREKGWTREDLKHAMRLPPAQIASLFDPKCRTSINRIDKALRLVGRRIVLEAA